MADNLDVLSALVNTIAALVCIFLMQKLTADFGFKTKMARIKLVHRLGFGLLASALVYDAGVSIADDSAPRFVDFLVQVSSLVVIALSAWRHHIGAVASKPALGMGRRLAPVPSPVPPKAFAAARASCDIKWPATERGQPAEKIQ